MSGADFQKIAEDYYMLSTGIFPNVPELKSYQNTDDWFSENMAGVKLGKSDLMEIEDSLASFITECERVSFIHGFKCAASRFLDPDPDPDTMET